MKNFSAFLLLLCASSAFVQINNCLPPTSQTDLDINNVRATILNGGDMWWDLNINPKYEVPKGSGKHSMFSGGIWVGGFDSGNQLKIAAQTYRQNGVDFWAGPINTVTGNTEQLACNLYDRHWKINKQDVINFINTGVPTLDMITYPGNGNPAYNHTQFLAPFFDANGDGIYDPWNGDYPLYDFNGTTCKDVLLGDQTIWWVFNDIGNIHGQSEGIPMGLEVHAMAYAYYSFDEAINNATFYSYKFINRSSNILDSTYLGFYTDFDVGNYLDDYVGCDVGLSLGYGYNGDTNDDGPAGYGQNPPAVGQVILEGPIGYNGNILKMTNFMNGFFDWWGFPPETIDYYNKLKSIWQDGMPLTFGGSGYGGTVPTTYLFPDSSNPANPILWSEGSAGMLMGDRSFLQSSGPFQMLPGQVHYVNTAVVWARTTGGGPIPSLLLLKDAATTVQDYFDNCFLGVGVTENEILNGIKLFPNPSVTGKFILANLPSNSEISIFNSEGKLIEKKEINTNKIEWESKNNFKGIYFIKIKNKNAVKTMKWVNLN